MIVTCPTCGNSGDWCQSCDGIGRIVTETIQFDPNPLRAFGRDGAGYVPAAIEPSSDATGFVEDIQPKPGKTALGPVPTRRKK